MIGERQLELQAQVVHQRRAQHRRLAQRFRVRAAAEDAIDGRQIVAAHRAVRIGVVEAVDLAPEEQVVTVVDLPVEPREPQPAAIMADEQIPGATGEITGEPRSCRLNSPPREKSVRPPIGPESPSADCPSVSLVIALPVVAVAAVKPAERGRCFGGTP